MSAPTPDSLWIDLMLMEAGALDRLIDHNPRIDKFRRVLNDERVAAELRVEDVARMLDLPTETVLDVALGRAMGTPPGTTADAPEDSAWATAAADRVALDLRPMFRDGHEPLAMILDAVRRLPAGAAVVVEAPFHPLPLRRLLRGRGYLSHANRLADDHWQVAFRRSPATVTRGPMPAGPRSGGR